MKSCIAFKKAATPTGKLHIVTHLDEVANQAPKMQRKVLKVASTLALGGCRAQ